MQGNKGTGPVNLPPASQPRQPVSAPESAPFDTVTTTLEVAGLILLALGLGLTVAATIGGYIGASLGVCASGLALFGVSLIIQLVGRHTE